MMNVLFSIFVFFFLKNEVSSAPASSQLIVIRVGPCLDRRPTEIVKVSEMSLHKVSSGTALSGPMRIDKDIDNGWSIKATMQKCHDIRNLDTCDFYKAAVLIRGGCVNPADMHMNSFLKFAKYVTPRLSCPIKAGNYTINKFPFFSTGGLLITAEAKISTSVFGYTYRLEGFSDEDDRLFCVDSSLRMVYIRKHDWIGLQKFEVPSKEGGASASASADSTTDDDKDEKSYEGADKTDEKPATDDKTGKKPATDDPIAETDADDEEFDGIPIVGKDHQEYDEIATEGEHHATGYKPDKTGKGDQETKWVLPKNKGKSSEINEKDSNMDDTKNYDVEANDNGDIIGRDEQEHEAIETESEQYETDDKLGKTHDKNKAEKVNNGEYTGVEKQKAINVYESERDENSKHMFEKKTNKALRPYLFALARRMESDRPTLKPNGHRYNKTEGKKYKTGEELDKTKFDKSKAEKEENGEYTGVEKEDAVAVYESEREENSKNMYEQNNNRAFRPYLFELEQRMGLDRPTSKPIRNRYKELPTYEISSKPIMHRYKELPTYEINSKPITHRYKELPTYEISSKPIRNRYKELPIYENSSKPIMHRYKELPTYQISSKPIMHRYKELPTYENSSKPIRNRHKELPTYKISSKPIRNRYKELPTYEISSKPIMHRYKELPTYQISSKPIMHRYKELPTYENSSKPIRNRHKELPTDEIGSAIFYL